jgi:hypothetical protein
MERRSARKRELGRACGDLVKLCRAGDRALQLLPFNEECLEALLDQLDVVVGWPPQDRSSSCEEYRL